MLFPSESFHKLLMMVSPVSEVTVQVSTAAPFTKTESLVTVRVAVSPEHASVKKIRHVKIRFLLFFMSLRV